MPSLLVGIGLGGLVAATGALVAGLALVALRMLINKDARTRQLETIRHIGIRAAAKRALLEVPEPEMKYSSTPVAR